MREAFRLQRGLICNSMFPRTSFADTNNPVQLIKQYPEIKATNGSQCKLYQWDSTLNGIPLGGQSMKIDI